MERVEEYIETIYDIQRKENRIAKTNRIAEILGVRPASVTEMLIKMAKEGYIDYQPYRGAVLTDKGMKLAERIKRSHNIFERFLTEFLNVPKDVAHELSCKIEHYLPESIEDRIEEFLTGNITLLSKMNEGNSGRIVALFNPEVQDMGLVIGRNLILEKKKKNSIMVSFENDEKIEIEKRIAKTVFVERDG